MDDDGSILIDIYDFQREFPTLTPESQFSYRGIRYTFAKAEAPVIDEDGRVVLGYVIAVPLEVTP